MAFRPFQLVLVWADSGWLSAWPLASNQSVSADNQVKRVIADNSIELVDTHATGEVVGT